MFDICVFVLFFFSFCFCFFHLWVAIFSSWGFSPNQGLKLPLFCLLLWQAVSLPLLHLGSPFWPETYKNRKEFSLDFLQVKDHLVSQVTAVVKESICNTRDTREVGLIPRSGLSPGAGNANPKQYSSPENFMDRGAWQATARGVTESRLWQQTWWCVFSHLVMPDPLWPQGLWLTSPPCLWDFPGKNTEGSCHFLLHDVGGTKS